METTNRMEYQIGIRKGNQVTRIKISLDDDCKNGHEDFSLTADIYENGHEAGGGCCHDHILKLRPDLALFAALHLSDYSGAPMHASANAFYWFSGWMGGLGQKYHPGMGCDAKTPEQCREIFKDHVRATDLEMETFASCGAMDEAELQMVIEDLGIPSRWKTEADAAIAQLETWTGLKFETRSTRRQFVLLHEKVRADLEARRASGYWEPYAVAARKEKLASDQKAAAIAEVLEDEQKSIEKIHRNTQVKIWKIETFGPHGANLIYYDHTNEITVNWSTTDRLITKLEFDSMVSTADLSKLPTGVKFVWQEKPKR